MEDDFVGELSKIRAATLIVWGDRDALCPRRDQDVLLKAIAGSRLVVHEGAGHALHWERPERFAADLAAFAKSLFIGAASPAHAAGASLHVAPLGPTTRAAH